MTDCSLILPDRSELESPELYVKNKLLPLANELHRLCTNFFSSGNPNEDVDLDMCPETPQKYYVDVDSRLVPNRPKSVRFSLAPDYAGMKDGKKLKIMLQAVLYVKGNGPVSFQLVRSSDQMVVEGSGIQMSNAEPQTFTRYLPYGSADGSIHWKQYDYHMQVKYLGAKSLGVCRRLSLTPVYV